MPPSKTAGSKAWLDLFRDELHALFRDLAPQAWQGALGGSVAVDVVDQPDRVEIRVDLMGVGPDRLVVEVEGDMLRLQGSRLVEVDEKAGGARFTQRRRRHFLRGIQLPPILRPETVEAVLAHGLLTIVVLKRPVAGPAEPTRPRIRRG